MTLNVVRKVSHFSPRAVIRLQGKLDRGEDLTPVEKLMVYQALSRTWRRHLAKTDFVVLSYIIDRSIGWGKPFFTASAENVLKGTEMYSGVGVSRTAYYQSLKRLEELGAIHRRSMRDRTRIWPYVDWCVDDFVPEDPQCDD